MKIGLVITVYNRPDYLYETLESLKQSFLPEGLTIFMVNDHSTDPLANQLFSQFALPGTDVVKVVNNKNENMFYGLKTGWDYFYRSDYDLLGNLDADAIVRPTWMLKLLDLQKRFPDRIITGYHSNFHTVVTTEQDHYTKADIGGINTLFARAIYPEFSDVLVNTQWDWEMSRRIQKPFIVARPSVVQHIGTDSSLRGEEFLVDRAEDWVHFI